MYNCSWQTSQNGPSIFFLGASLTGYDTDPSLTGRWSLILRQARHRLVSGEFFLLHGWSFKRTPASEQINPSPTKFGNCAETYPWVHLLKGYGGENQNVHGIALQWKGVRPPEYQDSLRGETWKRVADPCFNCQEIIRIHGGAVGNFSRYSGSAGGPP
jgi:hypothetical protein